MFFPIKMVLRLVVIVLLVTFVYLAFNFVDVWRASRRDQAQPVDAIVVLGAAQYNGVPSPVLKARLDHALQLWKAKYATVIVVSGGRQPGDRVTEATSSADYLIVHGVADSDIRREVQGRNSWQSLAATGAFLRAEHKSRLLLVSDPFHSARIAAIARELGLEAYTSPTRTSPIAGSAAWPYVFKETLAMAGGRIVGFRRISGVEGRVIGASALRIGVS